MPETLHPSKREARSFDPGSFGKYDDVKSRPRVASTHEQADHGRHHFTGEKLSNIEADDPFLIVFEYIDKAQELALPLIFGA